MTDFKPDDKVRSIHTGDEYAVCFGPYNATFGPAYVVQDAEGTGIVVMAKILEPIQPADPRVDVVAKARFDFEYDGVIEWDNRNEREREEYREGARAILAALDAMPKAPRRVEDRDGDVWEAQPDGSWWGVALHCGRSETYDDLADNWGPLTEV